MALIIKDRVKETATGTGLGAMALSGAVSGYQPFSVIGNGNTALYAIEEQSGSNWETGICQYISANNSIVRLSVSQSSNNNNFVSFASGIKNVFVTVPANYIPLTNRDLTQFAATSADNLRSIIASTTGTGSLVFANNAVLVNPTLGSANATALQLTNGLIANTVTANTLTITSSNLVANLNADLLDSRHVGTSGNAIAALDNANIWTGEQRFQSTTTYMGDPTSNTYFEFGRATNYPYIDFHSNTAVDYSARIACSGATAGVGGGTLDYVAAVHNFSSGDFIAAGSYGTVTIGNSSRPQSLYFGSGATGSGNTKTIGIGTGGASGSVTNIILGSSVQGATGKTIANQGIQAGSNGTPIYQTKLDFGSDVAGTWRKLVSVSLGTAQYTSAGYKIDIIDPNGNHAIPASINADKYTYYVACVRTNDVVQDTPDACYISGPASHIRAVKLSTGNYEIQVSNEQQWQEYLITVQLYAENNGINAATYFDGSAVGSAGIATYTAAVGTATDWFQQVRVASSGSGDALRITQTGTGNALVVEDEANPDSTPFVIKADGNIVAGFTTQVAGAQYNPRFEIVGPDSSASGIGQFQYNNDSLAARHQFNKTRATAPVGHVIVQNNDELGKITFAGSDGTGYIIGAAITSLVDGTPGTNDMPGRLVFSTTADGASGPTEAMRITNAQNIGIGTQTPTAKLDVAGSVKISQDLSISGNVYISGNTTTLSSNNLVLNDSIIYLANNNPANINDIGFVGNFTSGYYQHTGFVRDATDGVWKLFSNVVSEPTNTVDFAQAIYDGMRVGYVYGDLYGNANTATKLTTSRTISLSGAATGTATAFDGSQNITIPVTQLNSANLTGTVATARLGSGTANSNTYLRGDGTWSTIPVPYAFSPQVFTATAGQTTFTVSGGYVVGSIIVYQNGVKLLVGSDVTASDGTTIVLVNPADLGDTIEVLKYDTVYSVSGGGSGSSISASNTSLTATANGVTLQNGYISAAGDSKVNQYILYGTTTGATETELYISGNKRIPVSTNTTIYYTVDVVARRTDAPNESAGFYVKGVADNFSGVVADVGTLYEIIVARDDPNYSIDVRASNTTKTINMYVTGVAAKTIRWVANIQTVEVSQ